MMSSPLDKLRQGINKSCPAFVNSFYNRSRYKVEYGGAGSGKSHAIARRLCYRYLNESVFSKIDCEPQTVHTILVVRKVNRTLKKSCYKLVKNILTKWCRKKALGLSIKDFSFNSTDLSITHTETGSQIIMSGMDDPEKIKSIEAITTIWAEEATELNQEDFDQLDLRLRGKHNCVKEFWVSFNPVSDQSWVKATFFDNPLDGTWTHKTTYLDNIHIDDEYKTVLENKKKTNIRYYNIYAMGNWGTAEGLIFNNISYKMVKPDDFNGYDCVQGLDFGYTNDPTAFNETYIDIKNKKLIVYDGFYGKGMSNSNIADALKEKEAHRHMTTCDSAEPKSIASLHAKGCRVQSAKKGKDSVNNGIDFLQDYEIIINSHLVEFKTEAENYSWDLDKNGKATNKPVDDFNHFFDSLRYATEKYHAKGKRGALNIYG
jgi:phage terminase large subunit